MRCALFRQRPFKHDRYRESPGGRAVTRTCRLTGVKLVRSAAWPSVLLPKKGVLIAPVLRWRRGPAQSAMSGRAEAGCIGSG